VIASLGLSFSRAKLRVNLKFSIGIFLAIKLINKENTPKPQQIANCDESRGAVPNKADPT